MAIDLMDAIIYKALNGGGGGANIEALSVTENGTYTAQSGVDGYSPVSVNVPEPTGSQTFTENGTYDVTAIAEAIVNVTGTEVYPFYHKQLDVPDTTSGTPVNIEEVPLPNGWNDDEHLLYFISRYVGEVPDNHYIGSEVTGVHAVFSTDSFSFGGVVAKNTNGQITYSGGATSGVVPIMSNGVLYVRYAYGATVTSPIDGTYDVKIYLIPKQILQS